MERNCSDSHEERMRASHGLKVLAAVVGGCILLMLAAAGVRGEEAPEDSKAQDLFARGRQLHGQAASKEDVEKAAKAFEEAMVHFDRIGSVQGVGEVASWLGEANQRLGKYDKALKLYELALRIAHDRGDESVEGSRLDDIAGIYSAWSRYDEALELFGKALSIKRRLNDRAGESTTLNNMAGIHHARGEFPKALELFNQAVKISEDLGDAQGVGITLNNIGQVHFMLADYPKALELYEKSLAMSRKAEDLQWEANTLNNIAAVYDVQCLYSKAVEMFDKSLELSRRLGNVRSEGVTLHNMAGIHKVKGQFDKALELYNRSLNVLRALQDRFGEATALNSMGQLHYLVGNYANAVELDEECIKIHSAIKDAVGEGIALNSLAVVYKATGDYRKSLEYYDKSLELRRRTGDTLGEGVTLTNLADLYASWAFYQKAVECYHQSLEMRQRIGDRHGEGATLISLGSLAVQLNQYKTALGHFRKALAIYQEIGVPTAQIEDLIGNVHLDANQPDAAQPLLERAGFDDSLGRLWLMKGDHDKAKLHYERLLSSAERNKDVDNLFVAYTGLGRAHELGGDFVKAEEYYEKGLKFVEDLRARLLPSERQDFLSIKVKGFSRSDPAKGLTRVRMKLKKPEQSIDSSEFIRARAFSDHIAQRPSTGYSGVTAEILDRERALVTRVASLRKALSSVPPEKYPERYEALSGELRKSEDQLDDFVNMLWKDFTAYASVKFPRPVGLSKAAVRPDEYVIIFDVVGEAVGVKLIKGNQIVATHYELWAQKDLEREIHTFRKTFEEADLGAFDPESGLRLYQRLLAPVMSQVPRHAPLVIIPDGLLSVVPFEAIVTGGTPEWRKGKGGPYPVGLHYLNDDHPISYYQSLTAMTLARTGGAASRKRVADQMLVMADPVFEGTDPRASDSGEVQVAKGDAQFAVSLMSAISESTDGEVRFERLEQTGVLAKRLESLYGDRCGLLTGMEANKQRFLSSIGPKLDTYGFIVFATHGYFLEKMPGLIEPFLVLTTVPTGVDGFLKMGEVMGLTMNASVVALTACQTGVGREQSGEGVMSMGRAFQYAGAQTVVMSLWSVAEASSVGLMENFFKHLKAGKSKLEAMEAARRDIRAEGFEHPFFWAPFILVGEQQ